MNKHLFFKAQLAAAIATSTLMLSAQATATETDENGYVWNFLSGHEWPGGYNRNTGKPYGMTWAYPEYNAEFFRRISNALPEAEINEAFIVDDDASNITLDEDAEVFITFIHEGAGYRNSLGFFTYDRENPPQTKEEIRETIVFPNLSYPHMTNGHRVSIGHFPAGTTIGFFLAANGFSYYDGVRAGHRPHYYSIQNLNPDPDGLKQHNVLLYDDEFNEVILGFEDLPRSWGDNDFNDAVFSVKTTPETAIDTTPLTVMPASNDSDADGIEDSLDDFPNDYRRAFSSYFPSATDWMTLAFEDNWPRSGDYDMNDLVVRQRVQKAYNADGELTGVVLSGFIDARGANDRNGFALRLMDVASEEFSDATLEIDGHLYTKQLEPGHEEAVILLWNDTHRFTTTGEAGSCKHFNTLKYCSEFAPVPFTLDINFVDAVDDFSSESLDYFIYKTHYRGREIHMADYPPTNRFDVTQFGKYADSSDPELNRYFKTEDNLPWGLKINTRWHYPREYIDVVWAYPDFETWVESSGEQALDWHSTSDRTTHYFVPESE